MAAGQRADFDEDPDQQQMTIVEWLRSRSRYGQPGPGAFVAACSALGDPGACHMAGRCTLPCWLAAPENARHYTRASDLQVAGTCHNCGHDVRRFIPEESKESKSGWVFRCTGCGTVAEDRPFIFGPAVAALEAMGSGDSHVVSRPLLTDKLVKVLKIGTAVLALAMTQLDDVLGIAGRLADAIA